MCLLSSSASSSSNVGPRGLKVGPKAPKEGLKAPNKGPRAPNKGLVNGAPVVGIGDHAIAIEYTADVLLRPVAIRLLQDTWSNF
jgi:hypothetical protein